MAANSETGSHNSGDFCHRHLDCAPAEGWNRLTARYLLARAAYRQEEEKREGRPGRSFGGGRWRPRPVSARSESVGRCTAAVGGPAEATAPGDHGRLEIFNLKTENRTNTKVFSTNTSKPGTEPDGGAGRRTAGHAKDTFSRIGGSPASGALILFHEETNRWLTASPCPRTAMPNSGRS